jgi:ABC-type transport system substrate-binding protein
MDERRKGERKMKLRIIAISLALMFLATCINLPNVSAYQNPGEFEGYEKYGPRVKDLIFNVAGDVNKEAQMLEQGLIDFMDWAAPASKISSWKTNPNLAWGDYSEAGWYEYDLNLQMWPIGHGVMNGVKEKFGGPAPTAPMDWAFPPSWDPGSYWIDYADQRDIDARWFRKALAHLTDRDGIYDQFAGSITLMDTFIFPTLGSAWISPTVPIYVFGLVEAKAALDNGGFMDYDGDTWREYSKHVAERNAWKADPVHNPLPPEIEEIPDIQLWSRSDDPPRQLAGALLFQYLEAAGVDVDYYEGSYSYCTPHAWKDYDYHIYTGGWGWGSQPDMYDVLFSSNRDTYPSTDADNYNRYHREEYDALAEAFKSSLDLATAKTNLWDCEDMIHDDVACIPLYTMSGIVAHRTYYGNFPGESAFAGKEWLGFACETGYGYYGGNFGFSSINAHPKDFERGGTLRHGLVAKPDKLDPVDSESFYEAQILSKIYEPLIVRDPFNSTKYIPWMVSSFQDGTWDNNGRTCSKLTVYLLRNVLFHDNHQVTPDDIEFSYAYKFAAKSVSEFSVLKEYHHCDIDYATNKIDICFNTTSFLVQSWVAGVSIIPEHIFEAYPPKLPGDTTEPGSWAFAPDEEDKLIGTGPFRAVKDGVVGRIDKVEGEYYHLSANPTYYRELVRPDFAKLVGEDLQPEPSGNVDIDDWLVVIAKYGSVKPWADPVWGPIADVDRNYIVDLDDIMETGARVGQTGYVNGYPSYYG